MSPVFASTRDGRFTFAAVGRSLIIHDVRRDAPPTFGELAERLGVAGGEGVLHVR